MIRAGKDRKMLKVDLNSDLGESFGVYRIGMDAEILGFVTSANVACGFHAGEPMIMEETVRLAKEAGAAVGAHPGFPDLAGFGRRNMACTPQEVKAYVKYQLGALLAFTRAAGIPLQHCKAHGALYNMAAKDKALAAAVAEAVADVDRSIILLGLAGSTMIEAGREAGLRVASEVFADRAYQADGSLVPRKLSGAVIHDTEEAIARTVRMVKEGAVTAITGETVPIAADSVCVHGDNPSALAFVKSIRERLEVEGIAVVPLSEIV